MTSSIKPKDGLFLKESASLGKGVNDYWLEEGIINDYLNDYSTFINLHGIKRLLKDAQAVPEILNKIYDLNKQIQPADSGTALNFNDVRRRQKLHKRVAFDSIAHQGGLSGLSSASGKSHKLAFTFENLLPYLISEMRRNHRDIETDSDFAP
ncbi:uncharacterized protein LOC128245374 [Mya arenaria]|uniref:uncharacterized protein LOC128245374 n=1 Tax=Mya arenaria TaxID=6604 RepID=UPI0022DFEAC1|nr:uncharacterized protein LOC128245374 [Mya arenaria]